MKKFMYIIALITSLCLMLSCDNKVDPQEENTFDVSGIVLPSTIEGRPGDAVSIRMIAGRGAYEGDVIVLISASGTEFNCPVISNDSQNFTFTLAEGLVSGTYEFHAQRNETKMLVGTVEVTIYSSAAVEPETGATVYGIVECEGEGVPGVIISDGYEVVVTDENGIYNIASEKNHGYVFMSIPSGYEVQSDGIVPRFWSTLSDGADTPERADFTLVRAGDQTEHTMLIFGDMHLANRTNDKNQFYDFTADVNSYISANTGKKIYGLTLGDMTWDLYWVSNSYDLNNYLTDMAVIKNLQVFHTIGNHDHEMEAAGDFNTVVKYKKIIGPTYYSFNIGSIHYIVLDDIECTNPGSGTTRTYNDRVVQEQLDWLEKDLAHVDKSTPLVIAMHAPVYRPNGGNSLDNASALLSILDGYKVDFMTGHTHDVYNVEKTASNIFEHNSGAVCATWWWSGYETPGIHISQDGAPGGYRIWNVSGTDVQWQFKATGKSADFQFRTYDRNEICLTVEDWVPNANETRQNTFMSYTSSYNFASTNNYVLLNIWDWDPEWTLEVTENGQLLEYEQMTTVRDPLHLVAYTAKRLNRNADPTFPTGNAYHFFRVKASSATSTLEIKVTDRFGRVYTETMTRPKAFTIENYK